MHFDRAKSILESLTHDNIIELIKTKPKMFDLPYYGKTDLFELIVQKSQLSYQLSIHIIDQLIDAVSYLHENKICHLDIKPENIMILPKFKIKLIDFGSAIKLNKEKIIHKSYPFTKVYASPDRANKCSYDSLCRRYLVDWMCIIYYVRGNNLLSRCRLN